MSLWCEGDGTMCAECGTFDFLPSACPGCNSLLCWRHVLEHHIGSSGKLCDLGRSSTPDPEVIVPLSSTGASPPSPTSGVAQPRKVVADPHRNPLMKWCRTESDTPAIVPLPDPASTTAPYELRAAVSHKRSTTAKFPVLLSSSCSTASGEEDVACFSVCSWEAETSLSVGQAVERFLLAVWHDAEHLHGVLYVVQVSADTKAAHAVPSAASHPSSASFSPPLTLSVVPPSRLVRDAVPHDRAAVLLLCIGGRKMREGSLAGALRQALFQRGSSPPNASPVPGWLAALRGDARVRAIRTWLLLRGRALASPLPPPAVSSTAAAVEPVAEAAQRSKEDVTTTTVAAPVSTSGESAEVETALEAGLWPFRTAPPLDMMTFQTPRTKPIPCAGLPARGAKRTVVVAVFVEDTELPAVVQPFCCAVSAEWNNLKAAQLLKETVVTSVLRYPSGDPKSSWVNMLYDVFALPRWGKSRPSEVSAEHVRCLTAEPLGSQPLTLDSGDAVFIGLPCGFPRDVLRHPQTAVEVSALQVKQILSTRSWPVKGFIPQPPPRLVAELREMLAYDLMRSRLLQRNMLVKCQVM